MSIIVYCLKVRPYSYARLRDKVNHITYDDYSKSTIEKDVFMLREEFDCPIETTAQGLSITQEYDFISKIKEWIELYVE